MSYVTGNVVYIMTKYLSADIARTASWNQSIILSDDSLRQITFWKHNICICKVIEREFKVDQSVHSIVYSDASGTGYGGYIVENPMNIAHGMWEEIERSRSSTWRELVVVQRVLGSLLPFMHGKCIKWFTDNKNVVSIVEKGSMNNELQDTAIAILICVCQTALRCTQNGCRVRTMNKQI